MFIGKGEEREKEGKNEREREREKGVNKTEDKQIAREIIGPCS